MKLRIYDSDREVYNFKNVLDFEDRIQDDQITFTSIVDQKIVGSSEKYTEKQSFVWYKNDIIKYCQKRLVSNGIKTRQI